MNQYHPPHMQHLHHHRGPAPQQQQQTEYYSGQWTKEEQEYVTCLVDGFKNGTLDIPDGTSLRFFIAAKLGCKPKRVSKKYERSGYNGKQVYRRDTNVPPKELEAYRQRLKDCEKAFKDSRALVVSMQEAKTDGNKGSSSASGASIVTETPVISLRSAPTTGGLTTTANAATQAALEDRLLAMRSHIDRRTTSMLNPTGATASGFNSMMGVAGTSAGMGMGMNNTDMLQAMMFQQQQQQQQRQRAQAAALGAAAGLGGVAPTNKLLIDLYQRRQQLIMSRAAAAAAAQQTAAGSPYAGGNGGMNGNNEAMMMNHLRGTMGGSVSPTLHSTTPSFNFAAGMIGGAGIVPDYNKRDLEDLEAAEEQARKRARAA